MSRKKRRYTMGGNYSYFQVTDVTAKDSTVKVGSSVDVKVTFSCKGDPQAEFYRKKQWPFTAKVYFEGFSSWPPEPYGWASGKLEKDKEVYEQVVTVGPLNKEGVYEVAALVELDDDAGFVMGHYDGDFKISIWSEI
jgi:hypothetical protein